jgi:heme/copper-type cytochrome/quinol oxidase subunit 2
MNFQIFNLISFQDPITPIMTGIIDFHHYVLFYLILILFIVIWLLGIILYFFFSDQVIINNFEKLKNKLLNNLITRNYTHNQKLEILWTAVPPIILIIIAIPSLYLLFTTDHKLGVTFSTTAIIGSQWYWSYFTYTNNINFTNLNNNNLISINKLNTLNNNINTLNVSFRDKFDNLVKIFEFNYNKRQKYNPFNNNNNNDKQNETFLNNSNQFKQFLSYVVKHEYSIFSKYLDSQVASIEPHIDMLKRINNLEAYAYGTGLKTLFAKKTLSSFEVALFYNMITQLSVNKFKEHSDLEYIYKELNKLLKSVGLLHDEFAFGNLNTLKIHTQGIFIDNIQLAFGRDLASNDMISTLIEFNNYFDRALEDAKSEGLNIDNCTYNEYLNFVEKAFNYYSFATQVKKQPKLEISADTDNSTVVRHIYNYRIAKIFEVYSNYYLKSKPTINYQYLSPNKYFTQRFFANQAYYYLNNTTFASNNQTMELFFNKYFNIQFNKSTYPKFFGYSFDEIYNNPIILRQKLIDYHNGIQYPYESFSNLPPFNKPKKSLFNGFLNTNPFNINIENNNKSSIQYYFEAKKRKFNVNNYLYGIFDFTEPVTEIFNTNIENNKSSIQYYFEAKKRKFNTNKYLYEIFDSTGILENQNFSKINFEELIKFNLKQKNFNNIFIDSFAKNHEFNIFYSNSIDSNLLNLNSNYLYFSNLNSNLPYNNWFFKILFYQSILDSSIFNHSSKKVLKFKKINFDSYIIPESELKLSSHRNLATTQALILPTKTHIKLNITAHDVLHSWAVPGLGVKVDAVPGRINQALVYLERRGVFYGQCSELCGVNHGFMPIVIKSNSTKNYFKVFGYFGKN